MPASAEPTYIGDFDTSFAAPLGYYVDPENPVTPASDTFQTYFHTGELLPDGSIIAGGRHVDNRPKGDFYLRKFTRQARLTLLSEPVDMSAPIFTLDSTA